MGRFEGLTDVQWKLIKPMLPKKPPRSWIGRRPQPWRPIVNSILWILITGARWCDLPKGSQWAKRSTAHYWLGKWQQDLIVEKLLTLLREKASVFKMIDLERLAVDGFFFRRQRWRRESQSRLQGQRDDKSPARGLSR